MIPSKAVISRETGQPVSPPKLPNLSPMKHHLQPYSSVNVTKALKEDPVAALPESNQNNIQQASQGSKRLSMYTDDTMVHQLKENAYKNYGHVPGHLPKPISGHGSRKHNLSTQIPYPNSHNRQPDSMTQAKVVDQVIKANGSSSQIDKYGVTGGKTGPASQSRGKNWYQHKRGTQPISTNETAGKSTGSRNNEVLFDAHISKATTEVHQAPANRQTIERITKSDEQEAQLVRSQEERDEMGESVGVLVLAELGDTRTDSMACLTNEYGTPALESSQRVFEEKEKRTTNIKKFPAVANSYTETKHRQGEHDIDDAVDMKERIQSHRAQGVKFPALQSQPQSLVNALHQGSLQNLASDMLTKANKYKEMSIGVRHARAKAKDLKDQKQHQKYNSHHSSVAVYRNSVHGGKSLQNQSKVSALALTQKDNLSMQRQSDFKVLPASASKVIQLQPVLRSRQERAKMVKSNGSTVIIQHEQQPPTDTLPQALKQQGLVHHDSLESLHSVASKKQGKRKQVRSQIHVQDHRAQNAYSKINPLPTVNQSNQKKNLQQKKDSIAKSNENCSKYTQQDQSSNKNQEQMKHNLVYTDNQMALQATSPSAGLPVSRKKRINNRFPSSSRVDKDFQKPQQEGLPQITSPKNASTGNYYQEINTQHTSGVMTNSSRQGSNQLAKLQVNGNPAILLESNQCSTGEMQANPEDLKSPIQSKGNSKSVMRQMDYITEVERTMESGGPIDYSPRTGTNVHGQRQKSRVKDRVWQSPNRNVMAGMQVSSPVSRSGEPRKRLDGHNWSNQKQSPDKSSLSPRNFKNNPYTQISNQKHKSIKRQHTKGENRRQVFQVDYADNTVDNHGTQESLYKNYTLSKGNSLSTTPQNAQQFVAFQPLMPPGGHKSRQKDHREGLSTEFSDPAQPQLVQKSTRSQAKRVLSNQAQQVTSSMSAVLKGYGVSALPYQIQLKTAQQAKIRGKSGVKTSKQHLNRSKIMTPAGNSGLGGQQSVARRHNMQNVSASHQSSIEKVAVGVIQNAEMKEKARIAHLQSEAHTTSKMPSLTKQNQQQSLTTHTSVSVSRVGGNNSNNNRARLENINQSMHQMSSNDVIAASQVNRARSRGRHPSIIPAPMDSTIISLHQQEQTSSTIAPVASRASATKGQVILTQNVSRVKRRLDGHEKVASKQMGHRNLSQLVSRTKEDRSASHSGQHVVLEKLNLRNQSKPTMGEKTTEEDSGSPSPVQEVPESDQRRNSSVPSAKNYQTKNSIHQKLLNETSALATSSKGAQHNKGVNQGSKLEPIQSKESTNLKNLTLEKRLKNSETCPEQLSPSLPQGQGHLVTKPSQTMVTQNSSNNIPVPNTKAHARRNISMKAKNTLERSQGQTSGGTRNKLTHGDSLNGQPVSRKQANRDTDAQKSRQQELQAKAQLVQLRNFRGLIDKRRSSNPDAQPLELKEFQIGLQVGQGAFAIVRRAVHKQTKHVIAIKTYEKKNLQDKETQMAVHREINTLSDLWHPSIMKLHEVVDQRTQVHLIMEMCQGASIFHHIKKMPDQRLPEDTCKHIFKQLVRACAYMHSKGYAHRDLKLDNILMDVNTKNIKIIDFGFSLQAKPDEKLNIFCGTPHYMDPDIVRKSPYNGPAADVWACGVILYIIYVGKLPFFGEFEADLFRKIQNGKFTALPTDIGDDKVRNLFRRIFDTNPNTRLTAQQCVDHSWIKDAPVDQAQEQEIQREQLQQQPISIREIDQQPEEGLIPSETVEI